MQRTPAFLAVLLVAASVSATQRHVTMAGRKLDFALIRKSDSTANWGSWETSEIERLRSKGPGLYVKKEGATYVITDPATLEKVEGELKSFRETMAKLKDSTRRSQADVRKQKEFEAHTKEVGELGRQIGELVREHTMHVREGRRDAAEEAQYERRLKELTEKIKANTSPRRGGWDPGAFGRQMGEFGRKVSEAARDSGDRIGVVIDGAFSRGLARKVR